MSLLGRRKPLRDVDHSVQSELIYILSITGMIGLFFGALVGMTAFDLDPLAGAVRIGIPMAAFMAAIAYFIVDRSGTAARALHEPSGASTPHQHEFSREQALLVSGQYEEAAAALVDACDRFPKDARPRVMLAELYRDEFDDMEEAVAWYRRASSVPGITVDMERQVLRTLVELCDRIGRSELAMPPLSRAAELHAGDRLGHWARKELRRIKYGETDPGTSEA